MIAMRGTSHNISAPLCNALPSLCWSAFSLWLCCACILSYGFSLPFSTIAQLNTFELCEQVLCSLSVMLLTGALVASGIILALMHTKAVWFFIVGSILAFVFSLFSLALYAQSLHQLADVPWDLTKNYVVHVEKDAQTKGAQARTTVTLYNEDGTRVLPSGLKCACDMPALDALVLTQSSMNVKGTLRALKPDEYQRFAASHVVARLTVTHADAPRYRGLWAPLFMLRERLVAYLVQRHTPESSLIAAITCGFRDSLASFDTYDVFKQAGLAHLIAVSGAHMSLLCGFISSVLGKFRVAKRIVCTLMISFMGMYLLIAGFPISALRAAAMSCLALSAYFVKRRSNALQALCICIIVFLVCDTTCALSLSFVLSALATAGILMFSRLFEWLIKRYLPFLKYIASILSVSIAALIPTQALSCAFFETLPLYSLCANILATPFFIILCCGGTLALVLSCCVPFIADLVFIGVEACAFVLVSSLKVLNTAPFACVHVNISVPGALVCSVCVSGIIYAVWYIKTNPHALRRMRCCSNKQLNGIFSRAVGLHLLSTLLSRVHAGVKQSERILPYKHSTLRMRLIAAAIGAFVCSVCVVYTFGLEPPLYRLTAFSYDKQCCYLLTSQSEQVLINVTSNAAPLIEFLKRHNIETLDYVVLLDDNTAHYGALLELYDAVPYQTLASFVENPEQSHHASMLASALDNPEQIQHANTFARFVEHRDTQHQVNEVSADCSTSMHVQCARDDTTNQVLSVPSNVLTLSHVIAYLKTRGVAYQQLRYNDTLRCGNAELRAVWPHRINQAYRNGDSLALTLRLLTDAEKTSPPAHASDTNPLSAQTNLTSFVSAQTNTPSTQVNDADQANAAVHLPAHGQVSLIAPFLSFEEITDILLERNIHDMELACVAPGVCDDPFTAGEMHARVYVFNPPQTFLDSSTNKNSQSQNATTSYDMEYIKEVSVSFTKSAMSVNHAPP